MKPITQKQFKDKIGSILSDNVIPEIKPENVNEFQIGKNYFYEVKNNKKLIKIQKWINSYFQENVELNNAAIAYRKNFSYLHLFEPHRKNYHFLRLDIKSFFHSIDIKHIRNIFKEYFKDEFIDENKEQSLLDAFINLITYKVPIDSDNEFCREKQILPMGFTTSPVIANILFRKLDIQIQKFCSYRNIAYTRYADDMLFSSKKSLNYIHSTNFENEINILISQMNFKLNKKKTIKRKHTLSLNGYTIQYSKIIKGVVELIGDFADDFADDSEYIISEFRLSNKKLSNINKLIYLLTIKKETPEKILKKLFKYQLPYGISTDKINEYNIHQLIHKLTGYRSYLLSMVVFNEKYHCCQNETKEKYLNIIEKLNNLIDKYSKI
jgi:RNA-directed DNA polymerase